MTHKNCGGHFTHKRIREHSFSFMQCETCKYVIGGDKTIQQIHRLMRTKVNPTIR